MIKIRLLDADIITNLLRTSCIIDADYILRAKKPEDYVYVSTLEVKQEVLHILRSNKADHVRSFLNGKEARLSELADILFKKIKFVEVKNDPLMTMLSGTSLSNVGERSLAVVMFTKYKNILQNGNSDALSIVSNNRSDIVSIANRITAFDDYKRLHFDTKKHVKDFYSFYSELFRSHKISKPEINYFFFVSNIDARHTKLDMINIFKSLDNSDGFSSLFTK